MNKAKPMQVLIVWLSVLGVGQWASGQDWPQWRGTNRDGKATGFTAPQAWPQQLTQKWKVAVGDGVASPSLVNDRLYVFAREDGDEVLRCLDADGGNEIWQNKFAAKPATGPASGFAGPRASPTVAEGKVVTLGVRGTLSCLDAETGDVTWRKDDIEGAWPRFFTSSSPIIHNGLCIAQLGGEDNGTIVAYELESGNEKWKWSGDGAAYASPMVLSVDETDVVIAETDKRIVGLDVTAGELLWEIPYEVTGRGYNAATPIVQGNTILYSGSNRGVKAVQFAKGTDALSGRELWSNQDNSVQYNSPILKDGLVYGLSIRNVLFCINAESGETQWTAPVGATPEAQPDGDRQRERQSGNSGGRGRGRGRGRGGYGSVVDAGSVLFALTPDAQLTVFQPGDKEFKPLASYKVAEGETYAYPIIAGSRIFVKDRDSVILWLIP